MGVAFAARRLSNSELMKKSQPTVRRILGILAGASLLLCGYAAGEPVQQTAGLPLEDLRAFAEIFGRIKNDYVEAVPDSIGRIDDLLSVILVLEPSPEGVALRALKDHDNPDVSDLHVSLDPRTLLLTRS